MANTLSPEFTSDRVKIGAGPDWIKRFANAAPWATAKGPARSDWAELDASKTGRLIPCILLAVNGLASLPCSRFTRLANLR